MTNSSRLMPAVLGLSVLLASCGSAPRQGNAQLPAHTIIEGFAIEGKALVPRTRVALPRTTANILPMRLDALARTSSLPEWTGPQLFPAASTDLGINLKGDVYLGQSGFQYGDNANLPPHLIKFTSTGQKVALKRFPFGTRAYGNRVLITEDSSAQEVYQVVTTANSDWTESSWTQIYGADMQLLSNGSDQQFLLPINRPYDISDVVVAKEGIATLEVSNVYSDGTGTFDVRELAYETWGEIGLRQHYVLRPPAALKDSVLQGHLASVSDGSLYLLTSVEIPNEPCNSFGTANFGSLACPVVMGITKFVNGEAAWQVYWDSSDPLYPLDLAASAQGVTLLLTDGNDVPGNANANTLLSFTADGIPNGNLSMPLAQLRNSVSTDVEVQQRVVNLFSKLVQDDQGRVAVYSDNVILTGTLAGGLTSQFILDNAGEATTLPLPAERGSIEKVTVRGDYLYVIGSTENKFGNPQPPLINTPDDLDNSTVQEKTFLLPMDFQLNSRSSRS